MKIEEMKVIDVIKMDLFGKYVKKVLAEVEKTRIGTINSAPIDAMFKRNVVDRLKERGVWNPEDLTLLYIEVLEKRLKGFSATERSAILVVCDDAFHRTCMELKKQEENEAQ